MILHSAVLFAWVCSILWSRCVSHLAPRASHCAFSFSQQSRNPDFVPTSTSASSSAFASAFELIPGPCSRRRNPNRNRIRDVSDPVYKTLREAQVTKSHKRTYTTTRRQRRANKSFPSRRTRFRVQTLLRETILYIYGKARNSKTFSKIRIHSKHLPAARKHSQCQHLDIPAAI